MSNGYMKINKDIYDAWTPERQRTLQKFIDLGKEVSCSVIVEREHDYLLYRLNHPDFIAADGSYYAAQWGRAFADDGYNKRDVITALFTIDDSFNYVKVQDYAYA